MSKTIMVTGNLGYIGSTMVPFLTDEKGYGVVGYDIGYYEDCYLKPAPQKLVKQIKKDVRDADPADFEGYEWLRSGIGTSSITEMEIEHATLAPMVDLMSSGSKVPGSQRALFFFRNDPFGDMLSPEQRRIYTNAAAADETLEDRRLAEAKTAIASNWAVY